MSNRMSYNGYVIEPTTTRKSEATGWTLEVRITPVGRPSEVRRCRAPNTYRREEVAVERCLEFGRRIVDGTLTPRTDRTK